ncbi:MAG TPA: head GIN domain-containing protein [Chitinophagaceae bacterium]|nr:head GIN domain-containing protein [Chitinophagaceae bacterium]
MRNFLTLILLTVVVFAMQSCRVVGNYNVVTETRDIGHFSGIRLGGIAHVYLKQGEVTEFKITGESNIIRYIRTRVNDDLLIISMKNSVNLKTHEPVNIYITTPDIEKISVSGAAHLKNTEILSSDKTLELHVSGAGKIKMDINAPEVKIKVSGAGSMVLSGQTRDMNVRVSGAGNVKAEDLKSENAEVIVSGAGHANVFASVYLNARASGAGKINYWGNPKNVDNHESGVGDINKK